MHSDSVTTIKQRNNGDKEVSDDTVHPLKCSPISKIQKAREEIEQTAVSLHTGNVVLCKYFI